MRLTFLFRKYNYKNKGVRNKMDKLFRGIESSRNWTKIKKVMESYDNFRIDIPDWYISSFEYKQ